MKRQQPFQSRATVPQQQDGAGDAAARHFEVAWRYGWIGPAEAIAHLGIGSLTALYRLIKEHRLPYGRVGVHYRFRRADLDEWATRVAPESTVAELVRQRAS